MRKLIVTMTTSVLVSTLVLPQLTSAGGGELIRIPDGAIGVTEETFRSLKDGHCYYEAQPDSVETPLGRYCDALLARFEEKIVVRVEKNGELYWVNTGDGLPSVNRYLPDGFYKVGKRYFWVADGFKIKMERGNAWATILGTARNGEFEKVLPVSVEDFEQMELRCEDAADEECAEEYEEGRQRLERLRGKVVMKYQHPGLLYYLPYYNDQLPVLLGRTVTGESVDEEHISLFNYIKRHAISVKSQVMRQIPVM